MSTSILVTIAVLAILAAVGFLTFYLVQVLKSLSALIDSAKAALADLQSHLHVILTDVSDSTDSARDVIVRVNKLVSGLISIPDLAKNVAKQTFNVLLSKGKRVN